MISKKWSRSMMRLITGFIVLSLTCTVAFGQAGKVDEKPATEKQKIEALIAHVQGLKDTVFIRNDREYDVVTAAKFLRSKWESNQADVKSAREFIDKIATSSATSGKPYRIRFKDGTDKKSGDYLRDQLRKLEKPSDMP